MRVTRIGRRRVGYLPLSRVITHGEIEAWRCWLIGPHGELRSVILWSRVWHDGLMRARWDVDTSGPVGGTGVHGFKEKGSAACYAAAIRGDMAVTDGRPNDDTVIAPVRIAVGRVALWGDVVEHERGYRASHGAVLEVHRTIDTRSAWVDVDYCGLGRTQLRYGRGRVLG